MEFSVLLSVYKNEKPEYLQIALESIVNQTLMPNEIVIVQDGPLTSALEIVINNLKSKYQNILKQLDGYFIIHLTAFTFPDHNKRDVECGKPLWKVIPGHFVLCLSHPHRSFLCGNFSSSTSGFFFYLLLYISL